MKAKHIRKIRKSTAYFLVLKSDGMFGDFKNYNGHEKDLTSYKEVLARSPKHAAERFMKRISAIKELTHWDGTAHETQEIFAKVKVIPKDMPFKRLVKYFN